MDRLLVSAPRSLIFKALSLLAVFLGSSLRSQNAPAPAPEERAEQPALATPSDEKDAADWLRFSGSFQLRYEGLEGQFRTASRLDNSDHIGVLRTLLRADASFEPFGVTAEIIDCRHFGGGNGSALNTASVDTLDVLQLAAQVEFEMDDGGKHLLRAGRQTIDPGSRKLMARNRYRQTVNTFTGVRWKYEKDDEMSQLFWVLPVNRRPRDLQSILDNEIKMDDQDLEFQFMAAWHERMLDEKHKLEIYAFVMLEETGRHRELYTPGFRLLRKPKVGEFDYEIESIFQFGESRLRSSGADLDHLAWFQHAAVAYTFDAKWKPNVRVALDYASGDSDPNDGDNGRFDTLFGKRVDMGLTGIYGPMPRSNLMSPEVRLRIEPIENVKTTFAWRGFWLASNQDSWFIAPLQDPNGQSGRHVGQQLELRTAWHVVPKKLRLEIGGNYMFHGGFQEKAPGGQNTDTAYFYLMMNWWF